MVQGGGNTSATGTYFCNSDWAAILTLYNDRKVAIGAVESDSTLTVTGSGHFMGNLRVDGHENIYHDAQTQTEIGNYIYNNPLTLRSPYGAGTSYAPGIAWGISDWGTYTNNVAGIYSQYTGSGSWLHFGTTNNYGGLTNDALSIDPAGRVGVESSPDSTLTVGGSGHFTGNVRFDGAMNDYPRLSQSNTFTADQNIYKTGPVLTLKNTAGGGYAAYNILAGTEGGATSRGISTYYFDYASNYNSLLGRGMHFVLGEDGGGFRFGKNRAGQGYLGNEDASFSPWLTIKDNRDSGGYAVRDTIRTTDAYISGILTVPYFSGACPELTENGQVAICASGLYFHNASGSHTFFRTDTSQLIDGTIHGTKFQGADAGDTLFQGYNSSTPATKTLVALTNGYLYATRCTVSGKVALAKDTVYTGVLTYRSPSRIHITGAVSDSIQITTRDSSGVLVVKSWTDKFGVQYRADGKAAYYGTGGGGGVWGEITGTLSNQTDLNTALLGKQNTSEKGAANGYPSLDANSLVPAAYMGGTGGDNSKYLRGDRVWTLFPSIPSPFDSASASGNSWAIRGNAVPANSAGYLYNNGSGTLSWATPGGGGPASCKKTADQTNNTVTYADCSGLSFAVTSGVYYHFRFNLTFQTAATTTGIKFKFTGPTVTRFSCEANVPFAADGAGGSWQGHIAAYADSAKTTGVQLANTDNFAVVEGNILPSANGTLQLQFASEVASSNAIIRQGSNALLYTNP
jgi:hypothetical protein